LIYPITRSLYGRKIRQPIGGEFGFSQKVLNHYVKEDIWDTDVAYYGIDIWMTTVALANGFKICQSFLGAKIHNPKSVSTLAPMFKQVIGTIFSLIEENHKTWQKIRGSADLPTFGFQARTIPEEVPMEFNEPFRDFHSGYKKYSCIWKEILGKENHRDLEKIVSLPARNFNFPYSVWVKIIYDYILYFHRFKNASIEMSMPLVLESLIPLYFGFTASFIKQTKKMNNQEAEKEIEKICLNFEKFKPYLIDNWNNTKCAK
jgi:hypothetical protein